MEKKLQIVVIFHCKDLQTNGVITYSNKIYTDNDSKKKDTENFIKSKIDFYKEHNIKVNSVESFEVKEPIFTKIYFN